MQPISTRISREKASCTKCEKLLNSIPWAKRQDEAPTSEELAREKVIESLYEEHLRRFHGMSR
jgi:hypothetical protein